MAHNIDRTGPYAPKPRAQVMNLAVGDVITLRPRLTITAIERIELADAKPEELRPNLAYEGWDTYRLTFDDATTLVYPAFVYLYLAGGQGRS